MTAGRGEARVGFGYDSHRLVGGRPLILGGVHIEHDRGLQGHSDADVLCHAVIDALLGAAHLGNIGQLFPDTDEAYRGANSIELLRRAAGLVAGCGWEISNIDTTILLEQPKLGRYILEIEAGIAAACGIAESRVSLKPKTNEGMGPAGRGEGAVAYAVCLICRDGHE